MAKQFTEEDDALLAELGIEVEAKSHANRTPREERIIAGFEGIQRFVEEHGRAPQHGEDRDIFERLYAVRLDRIRELEDLGEVIDLLLLIVAILEIDPDFADGGNLSGVLLDELQGVVDAH